MTITSSFGENNDDHNNADDELVGMSWCRVLFDKDEGANEFECKWPP